MRKRAHDLWIEIKFAGRLVALKRDSVYSETAHINRVIARNSNIR